MLSCDPIALLSYNKEQNPTFFLYLRSVQQHFRGQVSWETVSYAPTVLWLLDWSHMDFNLDALALLGLGISSFILVSGCANMVLMAALWVLYMSLVNVGQIW